jgi:hypothetical protein
LEFPESTFCFLFLHHSEQNFGHNQRYSESNYKRECINIVSSDVKAVTYIASVFIGIETKLLDNSIHLQFTMKEIGSCSIGTRKEASQHRNLVYRIILSPLMKTIIWITVFLLNGYSVSGQIGVNLCACQPSTYTMTFNFSLTCQDFNVTGPGIVLPPGCLTEIRGQEVVNQTELVPISVQSIQIYELDQNLQVVAQTVKEGNYLDGSSFTYTSIIATQTDQFNPTSLPQGFQLSITGVNSQEESVVQTYIIRYNNDCGIFPVLFEGQTAGWTIFVSTDMVLYE